MNLVVSLYKQEALHAELRASLGAFATVLARQAAVYGELLERREPVDYVTPYFAGLLHNIHKGRLIPEIAAVPDINKGAVKALAALPVATQKKIAEKGSLPVVVNGATRDVPLASLTTKQVEQAVSPAGVRTKKEQLEYAATNGDDETAANRLRRVKDVYPESGQSWTIGFRPAERTAVIAMAQRCQCSPQELVRRALVLAKVF